jgi:serine protease
MVAQITCMVSATLVAVSAFATTINVPADQPTIQAAINVAVNGDVIVVAPGTCPENINFLGKAIRVNSAQGPKVTIIDGGKAASVVTFANGETSKSVLSGFTLQNGVNSLEGGGIAVSSNPTISGNIITHNTGCNGGGGIGIAFASPVIRGNSITNNAQGPCSGGIGGGGISVRGAGSPQIVGNTIQNNTWPGNGGGISLFAAGTPTISNNIIKGNSSVGGQGGGIWIVNDSDALIVQNLIYNNKQQRSARLRHLFVGSQWSAWPTSSEQHDRRCDRGYPGRGCIRGWI